MSEEHQAKVEIGGASVHVRGNKGEEVTIGPTGVHVKDGEDEVHVSFSGIRIQDGHTNLSISVWKPLLGCATVILILVALLTAVIVGIVKLMM